MITRFDIIDISTIGIKILMAEQIDKLVSDNKLINEQSNRPISVENIVPS